MYDSIAWLTDFSENASLCEAPAYTLSELTGARLILIHALSGLDGLHEGALGILETIAARARARGLEVEVRVDAGTPREAIASLDTDLVVMGRTGKTGFDRLLLGSTTNRLLRELEHIPVLIVGGRSFDSLRSILCAVDPNAPLEASAKAPIAQAARLAMHADALVTFLSVFPLVEEVSPDEELARLESLLNHALEPAEREHLQVRFEVGYAPSAEVGIQEVAASYDLVVMGARTPGRLAASLWGSVSEEVKQKGPVPVLVSR